MAVYQGEYSNPAVPLTASSASAASQTVTVAASATARYGVLAFSGYAKNENYTIEIKVDGTTVWTHYGTAGTTSGAVYDGPKILHTVESQALSVVITPDASDACGVNLSYRVF